MNIQLMIRKTLLLIVALSSSIFTLKAQTTTLFPYPVAPDTCSTLESRCNYIIQRFWDNCDFTKPMPASQDSALAATMTDYFGIMMNADYNIGLASIRSMLFKAQANQPNFMKIMAIAEFILYQNPVSMIDDVYLTFAQTAADASWMKNDMKNYYKTQIDRINASKLGSKMINCDIYDSNGRKMKLYDLPTDSDKVVILLFTGNGSASSISRVRLSTDVNINAALESGDLKLINIVVGDKAKQSVAGDAAQFPQWTVAAMPDAAKRLDLRILPGAFVVDNNFTIINKNITVDEIKNSFNR